MVKTSGKLSKLLAMLLVVAMVLSTMTFNFTVFAANANQAFTLTAKIDDADSNYNKGETITVGIYAKVTEGTANIGSFQFQIAAGNDNYDLTAITSDLTGEKKANTTNGKFAFSRNTADIITIGTEDVKIATATYVATNATTVSESIAISAAEITPVGYDGNSGEITKVAATANLYNIKVTFADSEGITAFDDAVAYAKYDEAGLYTAQDYAEAFVAPTATAAEGYRLYADSAYWAIGGEYKTAADIAGMKFTADATATATAVKQYKITLAAGEGTWVGGEAPEVIVADTGKLFSEIGIPSADAVTAPAGKVFEGWEIDGTTYAADALNTVSVTKDLTVTAKFADGEFAWSETSANATVAVLSGITDDKAKHGTDITFTAAADASYAITEVRYTVGGALKGTITPVDGVYTIDGDDITGAVAVEVTALKYHTVTFTASAGTTFSTAALTAYVVDGQSKLYASVAELAAQGESTFTLPAYTVAEGYRAADADLKWKIGEDAKTDAALASYTFAANTEIKTYVIKTWVVTFAVGTNGAFAEGATANITKTVDDGYVILASDVPAIFPATGYVFDAWTAGAPEGQTVSGDVTYTATFKDGTYDFTFASTAGIEVTDITGVDANKATHGTDVTFKLTVDSTVATLSSVSYKVNGNAAVVIEADEDGVYTVPGSAITATTTVSFATTGKVAVTFKAENGTVTANTVYVEIGSKVTAEQLASVGAKANAYYELDGWYQGETKLDVAVTDVVITEATEFTVKYKLIVRNVTADGLDVTYVEDYATPVYGSDVKFTIAKAGSVIMDVYYAIGAGEATEITPTAEGVYTIAGANITDDITITVNAVEGTISFITRADYKALVDENLDKKIIVFSTQKLPVDNKYTIASADMFWSSKYNAYVAWVDAELSEDLKVIGPTIAKAGGLTVEIGYAGDVNGDGYITASDAGIINDCLQDARITVTSDKMLFELDVEGTDAGNKMVTTADIVFVIDAAVK